MEDTRVVSVLIYCEDGNHVDSRVHETFLKGRTVARIRRRYRSWMARVALPDDYRSTACSGIFCSARRTYTDACFLGRGV
jgi:hypothetical protein